MSEFTTNTASAESAAPVGHWLGAWIFIPASLGPTGEHRNGYLRRGGDHVPLLHCSVDLAEFAELMADIEAEFSRGYAARQERV
ncbi:hypothetical protein [Actinacidiphila sp. ITFR-21]|uniref:hypothetical protein n=1 Tax=Actinacidiphila sp. ITFR-21 TaxID=3075199 RepID=UPI00288B5DE0|nr:hypothetical protein [Streptomyces sp. ITFR-21]WNI14725.1 hypothetical protein RLT57_03665 [Streptomyces sp. ITFR-21]